MTSLRLARDEAAYLAAFLGRIVGWDDRAAVRVQARGRVVGVYAPSPLDVLAFVALPLASAVDDEVDETVSAGRLRDIVGDVSRLRDVSDVPLPDAITGSASLAVLLTLSLVRAPRRDDHPPVAVACPSPGAGPHSTLPPTRCRVTAYGLMAKRSRSTSPTRAPRTLHADQLGPAAT